MSISLSARSACAHRSWTRSPDAVSTALPDPGARPAGRARRFRRARQVARPARARRSPSASRSSSDGAAAGAPVGLVLVPTRELAAQVAEELRAARRRPPVCGSRPSTAASPLGRQAKQAGGAEILVATPGPPPGPERAAARLAGQIEILVLDEADRMLDMGFRPQVDAIVRRLPRAPPDHVLLGHARRRGRRSRPRVHARPLPLRVRAAAAEAGDAVVDHAFVAVTSERQARRPRRASRGRRRARARLRPDEARRRSAREAALAARRPCGRDARRHAAVAPRARRSSASVPAACRRWSPPSSPPAASTWSRSRT